MRNDERREKNKQQIQSPDLLALSYSLAKDKTFISEARWVGSSIVKENNELQACPYLKIPHRI